MIGFVSFFSWRKNKKSEEKLRPKKTPAKRRERASRALPDEVQAEHEKEYASAHEEGPGKVYAGAGYGSWSP